LAGLCEFIEAALQFGLGCVLLVPQYVRSQQVDLLIYFCRIAARICKLFWRELSAILPKHRRQNSVLLCMISELFILPPKFLLESTGVRQALEDLIICCLSWAEIDHATASDTLYQVVRAQLQFLVSESGLPSRPQSALDYIAHALCSAASVNSQSHIFILQSVQHLSRSTTVHMSRDVRSLSCHLVGASMCRLLDASNKRGHDHFFDQQSSEIASSACCLAFIELLQDLSNSANFAEALADIRTSVCELCKVPWPSTQPPAWLVSTVCFLSCSLLQELISIVALRASVVAKERINLLHRRIEACQAECLLNTSFLPRSSTSRCRTSPMQHHVVSLLMFLTCLCDTAPFAFSRDMQMATSCIASPLFFPAADTNTFVFGQMLSEVCVRLGFSSASLL
jgi:hypothetical protein